MGVGAWLRSCGVRGYRVRGYGVRGYKVLSGGMLGCGVLSCGVLGGVLLGAQGGMAQVQGDGSLGSVVNGSLTNACTGLCVVTGGANPQNGPNLFHSFRQFSLPNGDTVQFSVTPNVENLLVRVTGVGSGFVSDINGTIQTVDPSLTQFQPVNFFLLNPNGIVFGPGAKLNVGGAVVATTAERITFQDGTVFSTQDGMPLLTVSVPTGLQFGAQPGELRVRGVDWLGGDRATVGFTYGNLALVGGNVGIENARIWAFNGELRIASLGSFGTVDLQPNARLNLPETSPRQPITIQNTEVILLADGERDLEITAQRLDLDRTTLIAGRGPTISPSMNSLPTIRLDTREAIAMQGASTVSNTHLAGSRAAAGEVQVSTGFLDLQGGSQILTGNDGTGELGAIRITATEGIRLQGTRADGLVSSSIRSRFSGNGGKSSAIILDTPRLEVLDGAQLFTRTDGRGDAGDIRINARDSILLQGQGVTSAPTFLGSQVGRNAQGKGGNISLKTEALEVLDGSEIATTLFGQGQSGNIEITAERIRLQGGLTNGTPKSSRIDTSIQPSGQGQGGDIVIHTGSLELLEGGRIAAATFGVGNASAIRIRASDWIRLQGGGLDGSPASLISSSVETNAQGAGGEVLIDTPSLEVLDGAQIGAVTFGIGDAGNIKIRTGTAAGFGQTGLVRVQGTNRAKDNYSQISSSVQQTGRGAGGAVEIETDVLEVLDGGQVSASTGGVGDAGNVKIRASDRILLQSGETLAQLSVIESNVLSEARGNGGDLQIETSILEVLDGAQIQASTSGQGDAGEIRITARNSARFEGTGFDGAASGALSSVTETGKGQGGSLWVETSVLELLNGGALGVSTFGQGDAGTMRLNASERIVISGSDRLGLPSIVAAFNSRLSTGQAGSIQITTPQLTVTDGAVVDTKTSNHQPGGEITLSLDRLELLRGGQITSGSDRGSGPAGNIQITATEGITVSGTDPTFADRAKLDSRVALFYLPDSAIAVRSTGTGAAGDLIVTTPRLRLADGGQLIADSNATSGGNITLNLSDALIMGNGSLISATAGRAQGAGDGGNIRITAPFVLSLPGENNDIIANAFSGTGGNITITADAILNFTVNDFKDFDTLRAQPTNDISASSQLGTQGVLNLQGLDVDPSQGAIALPRRFAPPDQVRDRCKELLSPSGRNYRDSFVITGRGGMAETPETPRSITTDLTGWIDMPPSSGKTGQQAQPFIPTPTRPLVEATALRRNADGSMELVAEAVVTTRMERPCDLKRHEEATAEAEGLTTAKIEGLTTSKVGLGVIPPPNPRT